MVSRLAVFETVLATGALVGYCIHIQSSTPALIATLVAPLLLLRSPLAKRYARKRTPKLAVALEPVYVDGAQALGGLLGGGGVAVTVIGLALVEVFTGETVVALALLPVLLIFGILFGIVVGFIVGPIVYLALVFGSNALVRLLSTAGVIVTRPQSALLAIPRNWQRLCFEVDVLQIPNVSPTADVEGRKDSELSWRVFIETTRIHSALTFTGDLVRRNDSAEDIQRKVQAASLTSHFAAM